MVSLDPSELHITYIPEVPTADIAELVDALSDRSRFFQTQIKRYNYIPGAGGIGLIEAAIIVGIALAARVFIEELTKDAYRGVKAVLYSTYNRIGQVQGRGRGLYEPLEIRLSERVPNPRENEYPYRSIHFCFLSGLTEEEFHRALTEIPKMLPEAITRTGQGELFVQFVFRSGRWELHFPR